MIYTTGLNKFTPDELAERIAELSQQGTLLVVDARSSRYSSSPAFKNDFTARANANVGYRWDPRIGGHPDEPRLYDQVGRINYPALIRTPLFEQGVSQLLEDNNRVSNVLVVCACDNHATCHRTRAVGAALTEHGIETRELDGDRMTDILDRLTPDARNFSARPIPRNNRHRVPQTIDAGREPKPVPIRAVPAAQTTRDAPSWTERLATRYAAAPEHSASSAMYLTTLDSAEALEALEHQAPSFIVDFRQNVADLAIGDAQLIRPKMDASQRNTLYRELAKLQNDRRPIAIVVDDPERLGMAVAIRDGGGLLAGLRKDVRIIDSDGRTYAYDAALARTTRLGAQQEPAPAPTRAPELQRSSTQDPDIFDLAGQLSADGKRVAILIPTNLRRRHTRDPQHDRAGIMGAGLAKLARDTFPDLDLERRLGDRNSPDHPALLAEAGEGPPYAIVAFNTKQAAQNKASLALIETQATQLDAVLRDAGDFDAVLVPRLGAGHGGLDWADVRAVLDRHLTGEKYVFLDAAQTRDARESPQAKPPARDDDFALTVRRAHERPPTEERFRDFTTYAHVAAAVIGDTRDSLGTLLPNAQRGFQFPAAKATIPFASVEHARRALLIPDSPEYQRTIAATRSFAFPAPPPPKTEHDAIARETARRAETRLLDYAMRVAMAENPDARRLLLSTKELPIVVASSADAWWSAVRVGDHYQGYNVLGKLLTGIRDDLARDPNALARIEPPAIPELRLIGEPLATYAARPLVAARTDTTARSSIRSVKTYSGFGKSDDVTEQAVTYHRTRAHELARLDYQLITGGALGMDNAHMLGVTDYLAERYGSDWRRSDAAKHHAERLVNIWTPSKQHERVCEDLGLPYKRFDETDPQMSWAIERALKTHPNPRALRDFSLRAHGRNAIIALNEDGKHPVEFGLLWAPVGNDGLPQGGSRGVPAILATIGDIPMFNTFEPGRAEAFDAYLRGIQQGTLRFGDGRDAVGQLYVAHRAGINLAGQNLMYLDPRISPLVEANLAQAILTGAVLADIDMTRAYAPNLQADGAELSGIGSYAYAPNANFTHATLRGSFPAATFTRADLGAATLHGVFRSTRFDHANLEGADLHGDFAGATFAHADLTNARLGGDRPQDLRAIDLRDAHLEGCTIMPEAVAQLDALNIKVTDAQREQLARDANELLRA